MEFWEQIIKTALLGTQKSDVEALHLPSSIHNSITQVSGADKEEKFLKIVSLAINYENAGKEFPFLQTPLPAASEKEEIPLCSREVTELLRRLLYEKQDELLESLLQQIENSKCRVAEELIPDLLEKGKELKILRKLIMQVTGKRGEWLSRINPEWQFIADVSPEEIWQTGKLDERKEVLHSLRRQNPATAREWLASVWKSENANTKAALLSVFATGLSVEDEPLLEEMLGDKSQRVREVASSLLSALPHSQLLARLWKESQSWIVLKKSGSILSKKTRLELQIPKPLPEAVIKDGIEPHREKFLRDSTSSGPIEKWAINGCSEPEIWLYQVMSVMPPSLWPGHLGINREVFLGLFLNNDLSKFIPALIQASILHQDAGFARTVLAHFADIARLFRVAKNDTDVFDLKYRLIAILPDKASYHNELLTLLENDNYLFYSHLWVFNYEWPMPLALKTMKRISEKCSSSQYYYYYYDARQVHKLSAYLPVQVLNEWEKLEPKDDIGKTRWQQATALLFNSLELKKRINEVFAGNTEQ